MPQVLTVSDVNKYIKGLLTYDGVLSSVWVQGEISNFKKHYSGHIYFTLKDTASILKCVMFKTYADRMLFVPENGMKVLIRGNISVFERDGVYQLYAEAIKEDGIGDLHTAFEQLKRKLQAEGLFEPSRKKPIPYMPKTIGVVTSETGSVIRDIIQVLSRRFFPIKLQLYPCAVQGEGAGSKIAAGIAFFNRNLCCDVIIVARGGGSLEDLWPFNEEVVARAIAASHIPVISGVGHETDTTICDYAADLRAPTPSAAAELAVPSFSELQSRLRQLAERVSRIPYANLEIKRRQLKYITAHRAFKDPYSIVNDQRLQVSAALEDLMQFTETAYITANNQIAFAAARLDGLSPLKQLARGYGAVQDQTGQVINSIGKAKEGQLIIVHLKDGALDCKIQEIRSEEHGK